MRGHWISTTRKMNKHYQTGRRGEKPTPSELVWGEFFCVASPIEYQFSIPNSQSVETLDPTNPDYYTSTWSGSYNLTSYMYNLCRLIKYEGYYYRNGDGCFVCGGRKSGIAEIDDNGLNYGGRYLGQSSGAIADPGDSDFYTTGPIAKETGILWPDYGIRYIRVHYPRKGFAPSYSTNTQIDTTGYPGIVIFWENLYDIQQLKNVDTGITLNLTEINQLNRSTQQRMVVTQNYVRNGQTLQLNRTFTYSGLAFVSGQTTYTMNISLYVNNDYSQGSRTFQMRYHIFLYNGDLYLDMVPEILYNGVVQEGYDVYMSQMAWPTRIGGLPHRVPFNKDDMPDFRAWVAYNFGESSSQYSRFFNNTWTKSYLGHYLPDQYGDAYPLYYRHSVQPFARCYTLTEEEFKLAEQNAD